MTWYRLIRWNSYIRNTHTSTSIIYTHKHANQHIYAAKPGREAGTTRDLITRCREGGNQKNEVIIC